MSYAMAGFKPEPIHSMPCRIAGVQNWVRVENLSPLIPVELVNPACEFVAPLSGPPCSNRGVGETLELPGWFAHVTGAAEDDAVGDGQHVPAGLVDYSLLPGADQTHLRFSDPHAGTDITDRPGKTPSVSRSRVRDDSYGCHFRLSFR
jgi:hypothetical protein